MLMFDLTFLFPHIQVAMFEFDVTNVLFVLFNNTSCIYKVLKSNAIQPSHLKYS